MHYAQVILNPHNEVVLECPLDGLMEEVRGKEFMDIRTGKFHRERLWSIDQSALKALWPVVTCLKLWDNPMFIP